ncbi:MAG: ATP-binding protein [Erysipelotrichaceae bacterium]|nr:ATP-binding protein [Erysipelotrichaceae bacterium]
MRTAEQYMDIIAPPDQVDIVNEDDLAVCPVCHEKTQTYFVWNDRKQIVHCMCKCERDKVASEEEEQRRAEKMRRIREMKAAGLQDPMLKEFTFEYDRGDNPAMKKAKMYVKNWKDFYSENIGLLLVGPVGTGKTFFAGCVANALLDQAVPVLMTNFSKILNSLGGMFSEDRNKYINSLNEFDLLIIDDLGIERSTDFALEQVYSVVDARYRSGKPMIFTTNLSVTDMKKAASDDIRFSRIYDRILEVCQPILFAGKNYRKENAARKKARTIELLMEEDDIILPKC